MVSTFYSEDFISASNKIFIFCTSIILEYLYIFIYKNACTRDVIVYLVKQLTNKQMIIG